MLELITELRWRGPRESEKMLPNFFTLFEVRKTCNSLRHYPKDPAIGSYSNLEGLRRIARATVIVMLFWLVLLFFPICRPHTEPFMIKQHLTLALGFTQIALLVSVAAYRKEVSLPCMFINGTPDVIAWCNRSDRCREQIVCCLGWLWNSSGKLGSIRYHLNRILFRALR